MKKWSQMGSREKSRHIQRLANSFKKKVNGNVEKYWGRFAADLVLNFNLADDAAIIIAKHHLGVKSGKTRGNEGSEQGHGRGDKPNGSEQIQKTNGT